MQDLKQFLWIQFRLHRAVDTLKKVDELMAKTNVPKFRSYLDDWDPMQLLNDIFVKI